MLELNLIHYCHHSLANVVPIKVMSLCYHRAFLLRQRIHHWKRNQHLTIPPTAVQHSLLNGWIWYICCMIWFITKYFNFQNSLMLTDGLGSIWHQDICSHHHDVYLRAISMSPDVTYFLLVRVDHIKHAFSITAAWNKCNITDIKYSLFIFLSCNTHLEQHCFTLAYTWTTHSCLNIGKLIGHYYSISFTVLYIQSLMGLLTSDTRARNIGKNFIFSVTFPVNDIIKPNAFTRIVNRVHF